MTATKEIAEMEIILDDKIQDDAIDQVFGLIEYRQNNQTRIIGATSLYCTAEHEYSIRGILKKAGILKILDKDNKSGIIKIELTHLKTIGKAEPR